LINLEDNDPSTHRVIGCAIEVIARSAPACWSRPMSSEGVAHGDRLADQFQRPAPHRRGEAIPDPAFRAGIETPPSQSIHFVHTL